jgi:hypothetical protein
MIINIVERCGIFAENKDVARDIRDGLIRPTFEDSEETIVLDFTGIDSSTQSFIHALISHFFQSAGEQALDRFEFKGCNKAIKSLISTVINYSLE